MRTIILTLVLAFATICSAQNFHGKAVYKTHSKVKVTVKGNDALQKQIEEQMRRKSQKTFTLLFNLTESIYQEDAQLNTNAQNKVLGVEIITGSSKEVLYKNTKEQQYTQQRDFFGKNFLITDSLHIPKWELVDEQKTIGDYQCYKALYKTERKTQKPDAETGKFKTVIDTLVTTAWYTPEIPVSNGPEMLYGLPGLILEVQYGKKTIACSEITLNGNEKITIEVPTKGKKVNKEEFNKIMDKQIKEMNKRNKSKRKTNDKNTISISIEG